MSERIRCPNPVCPQPDDVQKVSLVAQSRTPLNLHDVSWELTAPKEPENTGEWGCWSMLLVFVGGISAFLLIFSAIRPGVAVDLARNPGFIVQELVIVIILAVLVFPFKWYGRAAYKRKYAPWRAEYDKWEQLYYCNRCGSVFNPNAPSTFVLASRMKELLT